MFKLYRASKDQIEYWEAWRSRADQVTIHWGIVGDQGETRTIQSGLFRSAEDRAAREQIKLLSEGYVAVEAEDYDLLVVEYEIDGFGSDSDLAKRHALEDHLNELLGWLGLGHVDGGSIGSGTMEVFANVINFSVAKPLIEADLRGTEFGDFARIFHEDVD